YNPKAPWFIILFIPAAFSFVCLTEVHAFHQCLEEFKGRNYSIIFVSTRIDLVFSHLVPRKYVGLGQLDVPLLSDATHRMSRGYGVLIESEGISLRGMFILDGEGIVQQITLNNLTVGRSVLEAFQVVAKHGLLSP
ncbi:thioredoxin-like protein, partial [Phaeosphaeriaceae sp. PMI808]